MILKLVSNKLPLPSGFDGREWHYSRGRVHSLRLPCIKPLTLKDEFQYGLIVSNPSSNYITELVDRATKEQPPKKRKKKRQLVGPYFEGTSKLVFDRARGG